MAWPDRAAEAIEVEPDTCYAGLQHGRRQPSAFTASAARRDIIRDRDLLIADCVLSVGGRAPDFDRLRVVRGGAADHNAPQIVPAGVFTDLRMFRIRPYQLEAEQVYGLLTRILDRA
jgi:hypothetical protein